MDRLAFTSLKAVTEERIRREMLTNELTNVTTTGFKRSYDSATRSIKVEGPGFDSRLMQELRVRRGLTYGVRSHFTPLQQAGPFVVSLATRNAEAGLALQTTREVLGHYIKEGPTDAELNQAKANIIGGFPLRYDSNSKLLPYLAVIGQYHLPLSYLQEYPRAVAQVSVAQIRDAWQRRIDPQQMQIVTAGATP